MEKKGFLNKILHRKSLVKKLSLNSKSSISSNGTDKSLMKTPLFGDVGRQGSIRVERRSASPQYVDGENASVYDYDSDDGEDLPAREDNDSNHSSISSGGGSKIPRRRSSDTLSLSSGGSDYNEAEHNRFCFPTVPKETLALLNLRESDELPWVGLSYEAFKAPKYAKTSRHNKHSPKVLDNLFLAQELNADSISLAVQSDEEDDELPAQALDGGPDVSSTKRRNQGEIFVLEFSKDGKYLAAAGRDSTIKVWKVISSPLGRLELKQNEILERLPLKKGRNKDEVYSLAPVFHLRPIAILKGHTKSILSLDWSKNNFLISGSMDRTAKLWHVERSECLHTFQHEDFVTSLKFHPNDDRFFVSGCLDNHVRLWLILEGTVSYQRDLGENVLVTALAISSDGEFCCVGGFNGSVFVLELKGLHVKRKFDITDRSLRHPFEHKNGNRITGLKIYETAVDADEENPLAKWTTLITTNDSKIRLVQSTLKKLVTRFKGHSNNSSSIIALLTDDNRYIICASEDHNCYVWENNNSIINNRIQLAVKDLFVEGKSHIADLHIKHGKYGLALKDNKLLRKLLEPNAKEYVLNENSSYTWFHAHHSRVNAAVFAPEETKKYLKHSDDIIFDLVKRGQCFLKDGEVESNTGHIIVSTDQYGLIRVFRQDAANIVRKRMVSLYKKLKPPTRPKMATSATLDDSRLDHKRLSIRSLSPLQDHFPFKLGRTKSLKTPSTGSFNTLISTTPKSLSSLASTPKALFSGPMNSKRGVPTPSLGMFKNDGFSVPYEEVAEESKYIFGSTPSHATVQRSDSRSPLTAHLEREVPQIVFSGVRKERGLL